MNQLVSKFVESNTTPGAVSSVVLKDGTTLNAEVRTVCVCVFVGLCVRVVWCVCVCRVCVCRVCVASSALV